MHTGLEQYARGDKVFAIIHGVVSIVYSDKRSGIFVPLTMVTSQLNTITFAVNKGHVVLVETNLEWALYR